jgi:hypothetical protein
MIARIDDKTIMGTENSIIHRSKGASNVIKAPIRSDLAELIYANAVIESRRRRS